MEPRVGSRPHLCDIPGRAVQAIVQSVRAHRHCLVISRPSGRSALQEGQNLYQSAGIPLQVFSSRGCRKSDAWHGAAPPATQVDRGRAGVGGRTWEIRPAGRCHFGCRCNKRRTIPGMEGVTKGVSLLETEPGNGKTNHLMRVHFPLDARGRTMTTA